MLETLVITFFFSSLTPFAFSSLCLLDLPSSIFAQSVTAAGVALPAPPIPGTHQTAVHRCETIRGGSSASSME